MPGTSDADEQCARGLSVACPAKVNLALSVGSPRGDGMHPIASWMVSVDFADELTLHPKDGGGSTFDIRFDEGAPAPQPIDWPVEKDLAFRAHAILQTHVARPLDVRAVLRKHIPSGAGLGGGSADAAGMLVGLNRLFDLGLDRDALLGLAARLGSDVIFQTAALLGQPSALVTGVGERIEAVDLAEPLRLVLILPPLHSPTGPVYAAFDQMHADHHVDEPRIRALVAQAALDPHAPFNDLAAPAARVTPGIGKALRQLRTQLALPVHLTGSGAAMFTLAGSHDDAAAIARHVTEQTGYAALSASTAQARF